MFQFKSILFILVFCIGLSVTQAQETIEIRFGHYVDDAPNVDIVIDGEVILEDISFLTRSEYQSTSSDTVSISFVPTGEESPVIDPLEVELEPTHQYVIGLIGSFEADNIQYFVIDETAVHEEYPPSSTETTIVLVNGMGGPESLYYAVNDEIYIENLPFGEYQAISVPSGDGKFDTFVAEDLENSIRSGTGFADPYGYWMGVAAGNYPGEGGTDWGIRVHEEMSVNMVEYLPALSALETDAVGSFYTLSEALEVTGLDEALSADGPFTLLAPNDAAFESLPEGMLDELLADPETLAEILLYHVIDGVSSYDPGETIIPTLQGSDMILTIDDDGARINDEAYLGLGAAPNNGLILFIDVVLQIPLDD